MRDRNTEYAFRRAKIKQSLDRERRMVIKRGLQSKRLIAQKKIEVSAGWTSVCDWDCVYPYTHSLVHKTYCIQVDARRKHAAKVKAAAREVKLARVKAQGVSALCVCMRVCVCV
jgi:hypothetical protein